MYYKLENTASEMYQKLYNFRKNELRIEQENEDSIAARFPNWDKTYMGHRGQQNFNRVTIYVGLGFTDKSLINPKEFKAHKEHSDLYMPNNRTKEGKAVSEFLKNLQSSSFFALKNMLKMELYGSFSFPFLEIGINDIILCYFDEKYKPSDEFIEITSREFESMRINSFTTTK